MACDTRAGLEAQKLISISLGKMAASRVGRTGTSLHKSLLVASVLQRARHVFLEESYNVHRAAHPEAYITPATPPLPPPADTTPPTPQPAVAVYTPLLPPPPANAEDLCCEADDKENRVCEAPLQDEPPIEEAATGNVGVVEESNSDRVPLRDSSSNNNRRRSSSGSLKRRRCVSQQETQEAVWSILPKKPRNSNNVTTPDTTTITPVAATTTDHHHQDHSEDSGGGTSSMEVEHITSLVSIFSFGGQRVDLCGAQAAREDLNQYQPVALAV